MIILRKKLIFNRVTSDGTLSPDLQLRLSLYNNNNNKQTARTHPFNYCCFENRRKNVRLLTINCVGQLLWNKNTCTQYHHIDYLLL